MCIDKKPEWRPPAFDYAENSIQEIQTAASGFEQLTLIEQKSHGRSPINFSRSAAMGPALDVGSGIKPKSL